MKRIIIISSIFGFVALFIIAVAIISSISTSTKFVKTKAVIVNYKLSAGDKNSEVYQYYYKYTVNGKEYIQTLPYVSGVAVEPKIGSEVDIKYDLNNPGYFLLDNKNSIVVPLLIVVAVIATFLSAFLGYNKSSLAYITTPFIIISIPMAVYLHISYISNVSNPIELLIKQPAMIIAYFMFGTGCYSLITGLRKYIGGR